MLTLAGMTMAAAAVVGMGASAASASTVQDGKGNVAQPRPGGDNHPGGDNRHGGDNRPGDRRGPGSDGRWHGSWDGHRDNRDWDQSWVVRTFQNKRACTAAGWVGERAGMWDDSDCYRVGRSNKYVLVAHEYNSRRHHHR
ncbi:hypothetical protein ACQP2P_13905 [Dactylosporangium sp. CA-139114]|uniref:hypothetical protein n=1 Tax=Dactylosporangium sp. CA-139114 TaxID=3239931 RepID=UPI003D983A0F